MHVFDFHIIEHYHRYLPLGILRVLGDSVDPDTFNRLLQALVDLPTSAAKDLVEGKLLLSLSFHLFVDVKVAIEHSVPDFVFHKRLAEDKIFVCLGDLCVYYFNNCVWQLNHIDDVRLVQIYQPKPPW